MADTLSGTIERVTFHNADTGFAVLRVVARGRRQLVTVVGTLASANAGETIEATGAWVQDRNHGEQFQAESIRAVAPRTVEGIEKYLASGLVKGIGPTYARRIVEAFGERTLQVIDESPTFLTEVRGIGPKRIQRIRESWQEQRAVRDIMVFLQSHGLGTARAARIYKTYGDQAVEIVRANPYRLASEVWGFGFKTADELGARLGIDRAAPERARAALRYVLQQLSHEGHVGFPEAAVLGQTVELTDIPGDVLRAAVEDERRAGEIVREPLPGAPWLYLKPLFLAELNLARGLKQLLAGTHPLPPVDVAAALTSVEKRMDLTLAPSQRDAIAQATRHKVLVVTGGPGVGKTTIVRGILDVFAARAMRSALCAPTGRAAKRLIETTGRDAKTIHRLLEFDPALGGFKRDANNPLDLDLLVVDEASMVDVGLMNRLLQAAPKRACLVLVGDVDQLPPVGPGTVLADVIASGTVPVVRLTEIFRQAGQSWIVRAAHAVRRGEMPESAPPGQGDFYVIEAATPEAVTDRIVTMVRDRIPKAFGLDPFRDVQVLTPMNRNSLGAEALNRRLQEVLNPPRSSHIAPGLPGERLPRQAGGEVRGQGEIERFGSKFRPGDKVLQTRNNYTKDVFNGDVGRIATIDETEREVVVDFDGRPVVYDFGELDELALAFAMTVHKSQGSEYPAVVIPLHTQHFMMLQRNLLYTGITRGKKLVVLVGNRKALEIAVRRQHTEARCSLLKTRLEAGDVDERDDDLGRT
jgi:exodeoxyribonuclease V alpha subunit